MKNISQFWDSPIISFILAFFMGMLVTMFAFKYNFWIFVLIIPYVYQLILMFIFKHKVSKLLGTITKFIEMIKNGSVSDFINVKKETNENF